MKNFAYFIAKRYLRGHGKLPLSFSNLLSMIGVGLGVFSLLVVISVMNGFDRDIKDRIIAIRTDIKISDQSGDYLKDYEQVINKLMNFEYVKTATPLLSSELLIQSKEGIYGTVCLGIDYESYAQSTDLEDKVLIGKPDAAGLEDSGIILGFDLAVNLCVSSGDYIQLSSPIGTEATPFGLLPRSKRFKVIGLFSSGIPDYDQSYCYISLKSSQYFNNSTSGVELIEVRTENPNRSWFYRRQLSKELGSEYRVEDWSDYEANLFNAIKMEKVLMIIVLSLIILLAGFNMAGNLNRIVTEKRRNIGILQAIGIQNKAIRQIFLLSSIYIGVLGALTGILAALGLLCAQERWHFLKIPVSGFPINEIPVEMRLSDFLIIPLIAIFITILSALGPALRSQSFDSIDIIRNK